MSPSSIASIPSSVFLHPYSFFLCLSLCLSLSLTDLHAQVQRAAALERRKLELEAEQQTIEAYYQARLDEMQAQYDRLLTEVEGTKSAARDEAYLRDGRREHTGEPPKS